MKKTEFREIINIHPILLYKQDLFKLEELIKDDRQKHKNDSFEITLGYKEKKFNAICFDEVFQNKELPISTDDLSITYRGWAEDNGKNDIDRSISFTLYHNFAHYQISSTDENWYRGKIQRIREFFRKHEPWYSFIQKIFVLFGAIDALSFLLLSRAIISRNPQMILFSSGLLAFFILITVWSFQQKIFPFVKVVLEDKKRKKFDRESITFFLVIGGTVATIIQTVLQFIGKK